MRGTGLGGARSRRDPARFIRENLRLMPVPGLPEIRLYTAHPGSGLWRLAGRGGEPPYWAYQWAGGLVLARHVRERPEVVAGKRVLDLGAGSGLVGIAAAMAGAKAVTAAETDINGVVALRLNAEANWVELAVIAGDITGGPAPETDIVLVGDLFYAPDLAERVTEFLDRCVAASIEVLVGDPGRAYLPHARLRLVAEYKVPDFGDAQGGRSSAVFAFTAPTR